MNTEQIGNLLKPEIEIWKPVVGYEGLYEVSNLGRVKSMPRKIKTGNGGSRILPEKIMKSYCSETNTICISLRKDGKNLFTSVHRVELIAFVPNPENKPTVNHKDGNRKNNLLSNLEWATWSENNKHACDTGLNDPLANLPKNHKRVAKCDIQGNIIEEFDSLTDAGNSVGGTPQSISGVCNKRKWNQTAYGHKWKFI